MSVIARLYGILIALALLGGIPARAQISPGTLSQAHSTLDGPGHCMDCHDIGRRPAEFKCLDCHREIRQSLETGRGWHPALAGSQDIGRGCIRCHSDHNGRDFSLIHWDPPQQNFDHRRTGYILTERHSALACRDCHQPAHISAQAGGLLESKDRSRTFFGLSRQCIACHADKHRGQFSSPCESCHNLTHWKDALHLDHAKTRYRLEGPHEKVDCRKCHPEVAEEKPYVKYRGVAFDDCTPCHTDLHRGAFKATCKSCHVMPNWKPAGMNAVFDHQRSQYPLAGKHVGLPCKSCHKKSDFKQPVAHNRCMDCHQPGPHKDQFANRGDGGECASCHKVEGFKPATFDAAKHRATRFLLDGRHAAVGCDKCHAPRAAATVYRVTDTRCAACHADVHAGQFRQAPYAGQCEPCHTVKGFTPSTFTPARHQAARFPLSGAHGAVACNECHKGVKGAAPVPAQYHYESRTCSACHSDLHRGQFSERMAQPGPDGAARDCAACHTIVSWNELPGFEHNPATFTLTGGHRQAACDRCHRRGERKPDFGAVVFRSASKQCAACHDDPHGGQFKEAGSADCARCHGQQRWKPSTFSHNNGTTYALTGVHSSAPCAGCHPSIPGPGGKKVIVYRGQPRTCAACHPSKISAELNEPGHVAESKRGKPMFGVFIPRRPMTAGRGDRPPILLAVHAISDLAAASEYCSTLLPGGQRMRTHQAWITLGRQA
jgi:hypothetical protein